MAVNGSKTPSPTPVQPQTHAGPPQQRPAAQRPVDPNVQLFEDRVTAITQQREGFANQAASLAGDVKARDRHIAALDAQIKGLTNQVVELTAKLEAATKSAEETTVEIIHPEPVSKRRAANRN